MQLTRLLISVRCERIARTTSILKEQLAIPAVANEVKNMELLIMHLMHQFVSCAVLACTNRLYVYDAR